LPRSSGPTGRSSPSTMQYSMQLESSAIVPSGTAWKVWQLAQRAPNDARSGFLVSPSQSPRPIAPCAPPKKQCAHRECEPSRRAASLARNQKIFASILSTLAIVPAVDVQAHTWWKRLRQHQNSSGTLQPREPAPARSLQYGRPAEVSSYSPTKDGSTHRKLATPSAHAPSDIALPGTARRLHAA